MIHNKTSLKASITSFLESKSNWAELKRADKDFLLFALVEFVDRNANKFIAGGIKHADSDFLTETDHEGELTNELLDGWNYLFALRYNRARRATKKPKKPLV